MAYFEMGIPVGIPTICEGGFRISRIISFTRQDCLVLRGLFDPTPQFLSHFVESATTPPGTIALSYIRFIFASLEPHSLTRHRYFTILRATES